MSSYPAHAERSLVKKESESRQTEIRKEMLWHWIQSLHARCCEKSKNVERSSFLYIHSNWEYYKYHKDRYQGEKKCILLIIISYSNIRKTVQAKRSDGYILIHYFFFLFTRNSVKENKSKKGQDKDFQEVQKKT